MAADLVIMGRVTRTHGVRGEVRILPFTESVGALKRYNRLYFRVSNGDERLIRVLHARPHKNFVLLKLEGIYTQEAAGELVGAEVLVPRSWLPDPDPDEYYWADLIGLTAVTEEGRVLGQVKQLLPTEGDDLLVVEWDDREVLLPFREEVVLSVDLKAGHIVVASVPDLLEL
ncbi:MAG: 16S rRNA processing protein RimM [Deltaproteobacteria bacterium]|nr:16S rRNA processing protein RimM [Deltaproteobacteria bacterium]